MQWTASKISSIVLRVFEIISGAVVVGIVGQYLHYLDEANVGADGRILYAFSIAVISIFFAVIFLPPMEYSFWGFPVDFVLFVCWMVAFGLLAHLNGSGCDSYWYWHSWGWYWGPRWRVVPITSATAQSVGHTGCPQFRATIAFSFISGWLWVVTMFVSIYVVRRTGHLGGRGRNVPTDSNGAVSQDEHLPKQEVTENRTTV